MPRPPRIKMKGGPMPPMHMPDFTQQLLQDQDIPEEVKEELKKKKDGYVQFRMPLDVWARVRSRQIEMERDARDLMRKNNFPMDPSVLNIPMTEVMRKSFENPLMIQTPEELMKLTHKKGKGRIFR